jgi:hypothetical protein
MLLLGGLAVPAYPVTAGDASKRWAFGRTGTVYDGGLFCSIWAWMCLLSYTAILLLHYLSPLPCLCAGHASLACRLLCAANTLARRSEKLAALPAVALRQNTPPSRASGLPSGGVWPPAELEMPLRTFFAGALFLFCLLVRPFYAKHRGGCCSISKHVRLVWTSTGRALHGTVLPL